MESIILWILALFGLWSLISRAVESMYIDNRSGSVEVIVKVKNQEKIIEALARNLRKISIIGKITFIDMNSSDNTLLIAKKLKENDMMIEVKSEE